MKLTKKKRSFLYKAAGGGVLALLLLWAALIEIVRVVDLKNGQLLYSEHSMAEDSPEHPRLKLLRRREKLDQAAASGATAFEKTVLLRHWARSQWEGSQKFYYPPWDAVEILDLARGKKNYGFCAQYAVVFLQACRSLGLHARYVDLDGHFAVSFWSDEHNRWVFMDPTEDVHYEKSGVPLRGIDLRLAYENKNTSGIEKVHSSGSRTPARWEDLAAFKHFAAVMRVNQLEEPIEVRVGGEKRPLKRRKDYRKYPLIGGKKMNVIMYMITRGENDHLIGSNPALPASAREPDYFRSARNQAVIFTARDAGKKSVLKVKLQPEGSPDFKHFQMRRSASEPWKNFPGMDSLVWQLKPGMNELRARIATKYGWSGPESFIKVFYKPKLF